MYEMDGSQIFRRSLQMSSSGEKPIDERAAERAALLEEMVREHARFVFRVANAALRNTHDAEDVVQETFLRVARLVRLEEVREPRAFLARTAWRLAMTHLARRRVSSPPEENLLIGSSSPLEDVVASSRMESLHRLIAGLPEKLRAPLLLFSLQELGAKETGEILGIPEATVRTRVLRARQLLRQKLETLEGAHGR